MGREIAVADGDRQAGMPQRTQLGDEVGHEFLADPSAAELGIDGQIEQIDAAFVAFVNHVSGDVVVGLGHDADAVSAFEPSDEIILAPRILEGLLFDAQNFG